MILFCHLNFCDVLQRDDFAAILQSSPRKSGLLRFQPHPAVVWVTKLVLMKTNHSFCGDSSQLDCHLLYCVTVLLQAVMKTQGEGGVCSNEQG